MPAVYSELATFLSHLANWMQARGRLRKSKLKFSYAAVPCVIFTKVDTMNDSKKVI